MSTPPRVRASSVCSYCGTVGGMVGKMDNPLDYDFQIYLPSKELFTDSRQILYKLYDMLLLYVYSFKFKTILKYSNQNKLSKVQQ